ncbi:MAG: YbaB/EbfC family nucleoid-associated protein [Helicobacteraceae bacterium]|jgi:DNA-binding YbaB/EbfC family protein|nr:YbaB/EbfC family nucleoid-associated protein [Helicobacteraceae bacterium]
MFEGMDLSKVGELLAQVQKKAQAIQENAEQNSYSAKSGGGLVQVSANGKGELIDIAFDDSLLEDKSSLIILLIGAANDAIKMASEAKERAAMELAAQMLPFGDNR